LSRRLHAAPCVTRRPLRIRRTSLPRGPPPSPPSGHACGTAPPGARRPFAARRPEKGDGGGAADPGGDHER
ncbi:MAG TPA: hypothetical protein VFR81_21580, partial [Longimicrobium sp.]|nr:hypothetical protein [Longimicrobium sp.]